MGPLICAHVNKPRVLGVQREAVNSDSAEEITPTDAGLTVELTATETRNKQTSIEEYDDEQLEPVRFESNVDENSENNENLQPISDVGC